MLRKMIKAKEKEKRVKEEDLLQALHNLNSNSYKKELK